MKITTEQLLKKQKEFIQYMLKIIPMEFKGQVMVRKLREISDLEKQIKEDPKLSAEEILRQIQSQEYDMNGILEFTYIEVIMAMDAYKNQ